MRISLIAATLASAILVAPLVYLELRYASYSDFPYALFAILWLVGAAFILAAAPIVHAVRAGESVLKRPALLTMRVVFLLLAAMFWTGVVSDQMPCFLGVPNCD